MCLFLKVRLRERAETTGPSGSAAGPNRGRCCRGGGRVTWDTWPSSPLGGCSDGSSCSSSSPSDTSSASISFIKSSMANGACSTIVSKIPRVMLCKTRQLRGQQARSRLSGGSKGKRRRLLHPPPSSPYSGRLMGTQGTAAFQRNPLKVQCRRGRRRAPGPLTPSSGWRFCRRAR